MIRSVQKADAGSICSIYNEYIRTTRISFEEKPVGDHEMRSRIKKVTQHCPWLVYEENRNVTGYIYASQWKERSACRHSVEIGIYIDSNHVGEGIGTKLQEALLGKLKAQSIHSAIYGVALPNPASVDLCEKFGFEKVAHFNEVGFKFGQWVDVGYWERILT